MSEGLKLANVNEFERFFKEHHRSLLLYALKFVRQQEVANDIVQEAFAKLWEQRDDLMIKTSVKAYLYRTIHNLSLNYIEQLKLRGRHHEVIHLELKEKELDYFNGEQSLIQKEALNTLHEALSQLPDDYKVILELSRLKELKNKEISEKLNIPLRTVETRIYRAINRLRDVFAVPQRKK